MSGANRGNRMSQEDGRFYLGFHGSIIIFSNGVHDHISMKTLQCSFLRQMFCNSHEVLVFFILFVSGVFMTLQTAYLLQKIFFWKRNEGGDSLHPYLYLFIEFKRLSILAYPYCLPREDVRANRLGDL